MCVNNVRKPGSPGSLLYASTTHSEFLCTHSGGHCTYKLLPPSATATAKCSCKQRMRSKCCDGGGERDGQCDRRGPPCDPLRHGRETQSTPLLAHFFCVFSIFRAGIPDPGCFPLLLACRVWVRLIMDPPHTRHVVVFVGARCCCLLELVSNESKWSIKPTK